MGINRKTVLVLTLGLLVLEGCTVGPDFSPPDPHMPSSFLDAAPTASSVDISPTSNVTEGAAVDSNWWQILHDPELNHLIDRLTRENLDIQTATARLIESRAQRGITASELYPQVNGDASYNHEKLSDKGIIGLIGGSGASQGSSMGGGGSMASSMGPPSTATIPAFDVYQYGFDVSWEIDLWGRVRRGVEAADANLQSSEDNRRAVTLSSIAELVRDYVQLKGTEASLEIVQENLKAARGVTALAREREKAGLSTEIDVANAAAQMASTQAQAPPLEQQKRTLTNAIALLLALPPGALEQELSPLTPIPSLPLVVPIGVPSDLARRRPDIRQAEDQLHAATAEIGVAKADFFPKLTLMGNGMLQALDVSDLGTWAARNYTFGPSVTLPIFEGGRLRSTLELRTATEQEAGLQYRKTVLTALHEVDNALTAYRAEQQRRTALQMASDQNRRARDLAVDRYKKGLGDFLTVLTDEQNLLTSDQQVVQSTQNASVNMVQLYKALGGGWETAFPLGTTGMTSATTSAEKPAFPNDLSQFPYEHTTISSDGNSNGDKGVR